MAATIVDAVTTYGAAGACVALVFLLWGIDRVDPSASGAYAFRPLLIPGIVLLWPAVLVRWAWLEWRG